MKKLLATLATAALATTVALPAKAGYGWNVTHNTRFQFVPRSWRETTVVSNTINTGVHFQWTRYDGEKFTYPIIIEHKGNTCARPPTPRGSSHLTVCVDRRLITGSSPLASNELGKLASNTLLRELN